MKALALLVALAAGASPTSSPSLDKVRPPWGPMTGGTTVELLGNHFDPDVNRVFVGGREASVVRTIDEQHLEVVIPPSDLAGDAEILVGRIFNLRGLHLLPDARSRFVQQPAEQIVLTV